MEIASERYTKTCRWVLTLAHIQADEARATVITTEHMTAALAQETGCSAAKAMSRMGVDLEVWPESHLPGFALRKTDVFQSDMT